jgi:hypothetical protein
VRLVITGESDARPAALLVCHAEGVIEIDKRRAVSNLHAHR